MTALHVRVEPELLVVIDQLAKDRPNSTRSDIAKYLIGAGLESTRGGVASVLEVMAKNAREAEAQHKLVAATITEVAEQSARDGAAMRASLDLVSRLAIESLMILRGVAAARDPNLLTTAQSRAQKFYAEKLGAPTNGAAQAAGAADRPP